MIHSETVQENLKIWISLPYIVGWMQEGRKCILVIVEEKHICAQISFVFYCFLKSYFFHKNVKPSSWDVHYGSKCVFKPALSISAKNSISPKMSLTTFLHSHDDICCLYLIKIINYITAATIPLRITCPENQPTSGIIEASSEILTNYDFPDATADFSGLDTSPSISYSWNTGTNLQTATQSQGDFPVGTTTVTATATDLSGNSDSCTFTVTVTQRKISFVSFCLTGCKKKTQR